MEPKKYERITLEERIEIQKMLGQKLSYTDIANQFGRNKSSIQRDVAPYGREKYKAMTATWYSVQRTSGRRWDKTKILQNRRLEKEVLGMLKKRWSPDLIRVTLNRKYPDDPSMHISHEAIYLHVYLHSKTELRYLLRQKRKLRGNVRRGKDKRSTIADQVSIDERPEDVLGREIPGHWEGDLVMGKDRESAIGTLVERTTRTIIMVPLKNKDATSVRKAFEKEFKSIPRQMKKTLTYDNGTEMAQHKLFTNNTRIQVYFTHPYSPWERPTNENSNGLIRDYFPKGTDFKKVTRRRLKEVQNELNERPRKVLDYQTPKEVFENIILKAL